MLVRELARILELANRRPVVGADGVSLASRPFCTNPTPLKPEAACP